MKINSINTTLLHGGDYLISVNVLIDKKELEENNITTQNQVKKLVQKNLNKK